MVNYRVCKLLVLLIVVGLVACSKDATLPIPQTTTPTFIAPEVIGTESPATSIPAPTQTVLPSPTALPPTPTPTPVVVEDIPFSRFNETAVNLYFSYPDEWLVDRDDTGDETTYLIASNETLLDGLDVGEAGGVVRIAVVDTEDWISTVKDQRRALEGLVAFYESVAVDNIEIIQTPTSYRINGLEAATTSFIVNDEAKVVSLTFILNGEQSSTVISESSAAEEVDYMSVLEAITESIYMPEEFVAYQIATRPLPILFRHPVSWDWYPFSENGIMVGPYEVVSTGELGDEAMHIIDWADWGTTVSPQELLGVLPNPLASIERGDVVWDTMLFTVNGQEAAQIVYNGRYAGADVLLIYTVIAAEPYMIATYGITAVDNLNISVPIHIAVSSSIVLKEGLVDFADPGSVVEAIFVAAQTGNFGILSYLCDPRGEATGDAMDICNISSDPERHDEFIEFFATAEIDGEIVIDGYSAFVPFVFGPNKDQYETMELIRRNQLWYLLGY